MRRPLASLLVPALLAGALLARPAGAVFLPDGNPLTTAPGGQYASNAVTDGLGGAIVCFSDGRVYAQRITATGDIAPGWLANGVPLCTGPGGQTIAHAAADGVGGAIVVWEDTRNGPPDLFAQHVLGSGALDPAWPATGLPVAVLPLNQYNHDVSSDGAGGALVTWQDDHAGDLDIYAQRVSAAGVVLWTTNGVPVCQAAGPQFLPRIVPDGLGGAYLAWSDQRGSVPRVFAQHLDPTGAVAPGWPMDGLALNINFGAWRDPALLPDGSGGVFVAFSGSSQFGVSHPLVQRLTASGAIAPGWPAGGVQLCSVYQAQDLIQIVSDRAGGAILVWRDFRDISNPLVTLHIYARRVTGGGVPMWTVDGVPVCTAPGSQDVPKAVSDDQGGVIVTWQDQRAGANSSDVYALRLLSNGARAPGWTADGTALCALPGDQIGPLPVADGLSGAIVAWTDSRPVPRGQAPDVYATKTLDEIVVPVLVSLVRADARADRVSLAWRLARPAQSARIERRAPEGVWAARAEVTPGADGSVVWEDSEVAPGETLEYRLVVEWDGSEFASAPTRVEVPVEAGFALEGARPNPTRDGLSVAFLLPDAAPARLEVIDPAGRVMAASEVGSLGAGRHLMRLAQTANLRPGVYYLRLTRAGRALTARVSVVR